MKRSSLALLAVSTVLGASLVGYSMISHAEEKADDKKPAAEATADDYVLIRYEGGEVRKSELDRFWSVMFPGADSPTYESFEDNVKLEILRNLARERLVLDKAYKANIDKSDEVKEQLENLKRQLVIQGYFKSIMDDLVPEKDVKKEYGVIEEKFAGKKEVHARHILVSEEEEAKEILKQLKDGKSFEKLAKEHSVDSGTGAKGGDLGYFTKERMVPEFADAAFKLSKGEISEPVKSDFGWHIIKVEDKRDVKPPSYEELKEKIQGQMANAAIERYVRTLLDENDVEFFNENGEPLTGSTE